MTIDSENDEAMQPLTQSRSAPEPAFAAELLGRLGAELPARQGGLNWRPLAVAAGLAVATGVALVAMNSRQAPPGNPSVSFAPASGSVSTAASPDFDSGSKRLMERATLAQMVGHSPLWVRCRLESLALPLAHYTVVYPVFGECADQKITIDMSNHPQSANLVESAGVPGRDLILSLRPRVDQNAGPEVKYGHTGSYYMADDAEAEIVQGITDGTSFELDERRIDQQIIGIQLIVRARLTRVEGGESTWTVIRTLKNSATPATVVVDDQLYRNRAKAIVSASARKQGATPTQAQIDAELKRLVEAELKPQTEALLFLDQTQPRAETPRGRLRFRAYEDEAKQKLDKLENAIHAPPDLNALRRL